MGDTDRYIQKPALITITDSTTVSAAVDILGLRLVGIALPAALTGVTLTFQVDPGDGVFRDVYDANGVKYSVVVAASRYVLLGWDSAVANTPGGAAPVICGKQLKVVSGAAEGADRNIDLIFEQLPD